MLASKAEQIAIDIAIEEGYQFPEFCNGTTKHYEYSKLDNKDLEIWDVQLITSNHLKKLNTPELIYYGRMDDGKLIDKVSGVDK